MAFLEVTDLKKTYFSRLGSKGVTALDGVNFTVEEGEYIAIMGESGSGKTTLLNLIAALDKQTSGTIILNGKALSAIGNAELSDFRRDHLGFVFQDFNLLDNFTIKDNIFLPLVLARQSYMQMQTKIQPIVKKLGIDTLLDKYPYEVSGGEKQRAAIARALITNPDLLLADEPTGSLDSKNSAQILDIFRDVNLTGQTIFMVTHSIDAASTADRVLFIKDGKIYHQLYRGMFDNAELYQKISDTLTVIKTGERHE